MLLSFAAIHGNNPKSLFLFHDNLRFQSIPTQKSSRQRHRCKAITAIRDRTEENDDHRIHHHTMTTKHRRVTIIKPTVGKVKSSSYSLPDSDFVYGIESKLDKEGAGKGTPNLVGRSVFSHCTLKYISIEGCKIVEK